MRDILNECVHSAYSGQQNSKNCRRPDLGRRQFLLVVRPAIAAIAKPLMMLRIIF